MLHIDDRRVIGSYTECVVRRLSHWALHGRRDFASTRVMLPSRYEVVAATDVADKAIALLEQASPTTRGAQQSGI